MRSFILILVLLGVPVIRASASTWVVKADRSGDFPTIQAAVDGAEAGDIIELAAGTFSGVGNRNIVFEGKPLVIRSQTGASGCVLDCGSSGSGPARAFRLDRGEPIGTAIEGITILGGVLTGSADSGGAILLAGLGTDVRIANCVFLSNLAGFLGGAVSVNNRARAAIEGCSFQGNEASSGGALAVYDRSFATVISSEFRSNFALGGGAVYVSTTAEARLAATLLTGNVAGGTSAPNLNGGAIHATESILRVERCTLTDNHSGGSEGGGIFTRLSSFEIIGSTFWGNSAASGGALACAVGGTGSIENTIIAGTTAGGAVACETILVSVACTDIQGNGGGDWAGGIENMAGIDGNISIDPRFCDPETGDFTLDSGSPCAPFSEPNPACDRIGVHLVTCGAQPVISRSWGQIKGAYR